MINAISHRLGIPSSATSLSPTSVTAPSSPSVPLSNDSSGVPPSNTSRASKEKIATNFGQSAQTYQAQAHLQRQCAHHLLAFLDQSCQQHNGDLPDGPILEIGCGTGFITQHLIDRFLNSPLAQNHPITHPLHITDLSSDMVQFCQHHVSSPPSPASTPLRASLLPLSFHTLDAEASSALPETYSLIVGGFVAQWFKQLDQTIQRLLRQLKPGGRLLLSFPGHQSFPEWRERCDRLHLPYTAHPLPNPHALIQQLQLSPHQYNLRVDMCPTYYDSAKAFFQSMKKIGAGASDAGQCLSPKQMRRLLRDWKPSETNVSLESGAEPLAEKGTEKHHSVEVHYEVVYLLFFKA